MKRHSKPFPTRLVQAAQRGFTMIELIVVVVVLGILAATALPKFIDMRSDASLASVQGVAGAAAAAMSLNYSGCQLKNNVATAGKCVTINTCAGVVNLLAGAALPTGYVASAATTDIGTTDGTTATCTITGGTPSQTANFTGISAGN